MNKGDVVTIRDSSYSKVITDHGLENSYVGINSVRNEQGVVIETGCEFSSQHEFQTRNCTFNNTVVRTDSGKIVFIEECLLKLVPPKHRVMINMVCYSGYAMTGEIIEISDELYKEIKRDAVPGGRKEK